MKYQEAFELLQTLLRIPSVTDRVDEVNKATAVMKEYLDSHGLHTLVEHFDGRDVLYASKQPGTHHRLLFNAHLDVVPPSVDGQFNPMVKDGNLIARGAVDDKGNAVAVAQMLVNADPKADVAAFFSADEEVGGETTRAMVEAGYVPTEMGVFCDTESSSELSVSQKGILIVKLVAHGVSCHASEPWLASNPILTLAKALDRLGEAWVNPTEEDQWKNSLAPCIIKGGNVHNQIPEDAEAILNIRYVKQGDEQKILDFIRTTTGLEDVQLLGEAILPMDCQADHPFLVRLKDCIEKHNGGKAVTCTKLNGATDAHQMAHLNLPIAIVGIDGGDEHGKREFLNLEAFEQAIDAWTEFANTFC